MRQVEATWDSNSSFVRLAENWVQAAVGEDMVGHYTVTLYHHLVGQTMDHTLEVGLLVLGRHSERHTATEYAWTGSWVAVSFQVDSSRGLP